ICRASFEVVDVATALQALITGSSFTGRRASIMFSLSRRIVQLFSLIVAAAMLLGQAHAETPEFSLRGKVLDPNPAPIVGAQITATPDGSSSGSVALTNKLGEFSLLLKPGRYSLT